MDSKALETTRTGHVYAMGDPEAAELWLVLHGYGQLAERFLRYFHGLAGPRRRIVAPEGLSRYYLDDSYERVGASWMTRLDRQNELDDCHRWLDQVLASELSDRADPPRLTVLGFSQGAPTAGRWLLQRRPQGAERLICWGAGLPHDVDLRDYSEVFDDIRLDFVVGGSDEYLTDQRVARERERLTLAHIYAHWTQYEGGHRVDRAVLRQLAEG